MRRRIRGFRTQAKEPVNGEGIFRETFMGRECGDVFGQSRKGLPYREEVKGERKRYEIKTDDARSQSDGDRHLLVVSLLEEDPEFADKCDWSKLDGSDWVSLLEEKPEFADKCDWTKLFKDDWERLFEKRPEFADKCDPSMIRSAPPKRDFFDDLPFDDLPFDDLPFDDLPF